MIAGLEKGGFWRKPCLLEDVQRPISVSAVPVGPSIDIWRSCRFLGTLLRSLLEMPGELGRFLPCRIGANHCRLRSICWEKCGHGLASGLLEASRAGFWMICCPSLGTQQVLWNLCWLVISRCVTALPRFPE